MQDRRDDYEPIIATRPSRKPQREDTPPLWRMVLLLAAGLAVAVSVVWWLLMGRSSNDDASTTPQSESSTPEVLPETHVEQEIVPPARDAEANEEVAQVPTLPAPAAESAAPSEQAATSSEQASTPESILEGVPEGVPDEEPQVPAPPAPISVRLTSPDPQVRIELWRPLDTSPLLTSEVGNVVAVPPGIYRVVASGAQFEPFEQEVTFDGERPLEYIVELCAKPTQQREELTGRVVEERACGSAEECESMFMVLSEYAEQLVKDRAFRTEQCAKWRPDAAPDGSWTLNINCGGATLDTTCRIEIAEGACTFAEAPRSSRGTACPRAELR